MKKKRIFENTTFVLKRVLQYCPRYLFVILVTSALASCLSVINTFFLKITVDVVSGADQRGTVFLLISVFTGTNVTVKIIISFLTNYLSPKYKQILHEKLQKEVLCKASQVQFKQIDSVSYYDKFSLALKQADTRFVAIINTICNLITGIFSISAFTIIIVSIQKTLLVYIVVALLATLSLNLFLTRINHEYIVSSIPLQRKMNYVERVSYLREYTQELHLNQSFVDVIMLKFDDAEKQAIALIKKYGIKISIIQSGSLTIPMLLQAVSMIYAAHGISDGTFTVGEFILISNSCLNLFNQLNSFMGSFYQLYEHGLYIDNYKEYLDLPTEGDYYGSLQQLDTIDISLRNVSYSYEGAPSEILKNVNIKLKHGEKVVIVGQNGRGKSTLAKLLCGLYPPTKGDIFINNVPLRNYDIQQYRSCCCIISQDFTIFAASIAENILMRPFLGEDDTAKVIWALQQVEMWEKVAQLQNGILSQITCEFDKDGVIFSGGELQRIALARTFAKDYPVIILDEATSQIDETTEAKIYQRLFQQKQNSTIIVISHHPDKISGVDKMYQICEHSVLETDSDWEERK